MFQNNLNSDKIMSDDLMNDAVKGPRLFLTEEDDFTPQKTEFVSEHSSFITDNLKSLSK